MSANIRTGSSNTRALNRLQTQLTLGRYQLTNYRKKPDSSVADTLTYYLLSNGSILTFREWYQANRPNFEATGSKAACKSFWQGMQTS